MSDRRRIGSEHLQSPTREERGRSLRASVAHFVRSLQCLRRLFAPRGCPFESHPTQQPQPHTSPASRLTARGFAARVRRIPRTRSSRSPLATAPRRAGRERSSRLQPAATPPATPPQSVYKSSSIRLALTHFAPASSARRLNAFPVLPQHRDREKHPAGRGGRDGEVVVDGDAADDRREPVGDRGEDRAGECDGDADAGPERGYGEQER